MWYWHWWQELWNFYASYFLISSYFLLYTGSYYLSFILAFSYLIQHALTCMMTSHPTLLPFILYHLISFCPASVYPILLLLILYLSLYIITYYPVLFLCFLNISCLFIKILIDHNFFVKIFAHRFLCKNIVLTHEFNITDWLLCALISFITLFIVWQHGGGRCWPLQRGHRQSFTVQRAQPWSTPVDGQLPFQHWETEVRQDNCGVNYPEFPHCLTGSLQRSEQWVIMQS